LARRFQFRLETLLRVRELREREAKRNVATKRAEIALLDRLDAQTAVEITRHQELLRLQQGQGHLDALTLQRGRAWIAYLRRSIALRQSQRIELLSQLQELQAVWRTARTQARIIDKLRERRWNEYVHERQRQEQAADDELAQRLPGDEWTQ
jgi:flagellar export protein FliJ